MLERPNEELRRRTRVVRISGKFATDRVLCVETHDESWLENK